MGLKTPFFSAFGPLLFGRRAHRKLPVIDEDFGQLQSLLGAHVPKGLLAPATGGVNSRRRVFSVEVTFWAFLFQVLWPSCACREVVRKVQSWWRGRRTLAAGSAAYCMARARLPLATLQKLFATLVEILQKRTLDAERWLGERRVKILDGTGLSMPDTAASQERWPQSKGQKPGCGFPLLRMACLFCLGSGALLRHAFGDKHTQENHLAREMLGGLEKGDVLLADRGFCSFGFIGVLLARGVDCVLRLHQARPHDMRQGRRLGKDDRLVCWQKPSASAHRKNPWIAERDTLPATLNVRLVRFRVEVPGFRSEVITLATTLHDPAEYPLEVLADLYRARWNIELRYREIKTTMGAEVLRCQSPAMIEKELCMNAIGYNLIRCVMQQAAQRHDVELGRISFKGTLDAVRHFADAIHASARIAIAASVDAVRHFADAIHAASGKPRRQSQLYDELLSILAEDTLPWRPDRSEPRAKKRRPKNYQLLNKPRHQMRVIPHRNNHRAASHGGLI